MTESKGAVAVDVCLDDVGGAVLVHEQDVDEGLPVVPKHVSSPSPSCWRLRSEFLPAVLEGAHRAQVQRDQLLDELGYDLPESGSGSNKCAHILADSNPACGALEYP